MSKASDKVWHKGLIFKLKQNAISGNLLSTLTDFLKLRKQRVVLNGQLSSWSNIETGVPQGSALGPLLFLIYINNLLDGLTTNARLFADDVSLFSVVDKINFSATNLNSDLSKINALVNQWKMTFNPDPKKQAQEIIFSRKIKKILHPYTLHLTLIITLFSKYSFKNAWAFIWTVNWTHMNTFKTCLKK